MMKFISITEDKNGFKIVFNKHQNFHEILCVGRTTHFAKVKVRQGLVFSEESEVISVQTGKQGDDGPIEQTI